MNTNDREELNTTLGEEGYALDTPQPEGNMPPGRGAFVLPHFSSFAALQNFASRTYRWQFDEALRHSRTNALAIRRDPVVIAALRARQIPVVQLGWHLEGPLDQDQRQEEAIAGMTLALEHFPRWQTFLMHLQEAVWFGRYGVQMAYQWRFDSGRRLLTVRDFRPINGDKLVFRWSGQAGLLVHAAQYKGPKSPTERGMAHFLNTHEREQVVIHHYEPEDADFYEGELAGSVFGVGIRSRIYWLWWLRSQILAFLMDYLERIGAGGLTVYYYEAGNPDSLEEVKKAAEEQWRNNAILFPRYRQGGANAGPGVQRVEPSPAGAQLLESLITGYFDDAIRLLILGQELTSEAGSTGLGSGVAELQGDTFSRLVKYDAVALQETITSDLISVMQRYNFPGSPPLKFVFDVDKPNAVEVAEAAQMFYQMGGTVSEKQLREVLGLEEPQPGEPLLAQMQSMQPAAVGAMPTGVPVEAPGGPPQAGGQQAGGQVDPAVLAALQAQGGAPAGGPQSYRRKGRRRKFGRPNPKAEEAINTLRGRLRVLGYGNYPAGKVIPSATERDRKDIRDRNKIMRASEDNAVMDEMIRHHVTRKLGGAGPGFMKAFHEGTGDYLGPWILRNHFGQYVERGQDIPEEALQGFLGEVNRLEILRKDDIPQQPLPQQGRTRAVPLSSSVQPDQPTRIQRSKRRGRTPKKSLRSTSAL